ncbi:hypothetical protein N7456_013411 [Penicillium angulare]|uniref:Uncharacterized protein n=1 Tax=Penicillium angulare TaxID=116970 RepID=A0A9W9EG40_9EURO|nr:hypothetical protein N7456_013411 [Penicillium angulare]
MDGSTLKIRDRILSQIPGILTELLSDVGTNTMRILGDTPNSILDPGNYLESIREFAVKVQDSLHKHDANNKTCFVAVTIYHGKHSYFVVDFNNTYYDYQTAHECMALIPVYVLRLSKRTPRIFRNRLLDETIARTLRVMHNGHGQDPLPLFDNYRDPNACYSNPRNRQH